MGFAPTDSDFPPLVGGVMATKGRAATKRWLLGLKKNANFYADDESVVNAVNRGLASVGIINAYYWYRLRDEVGDGGMHSKLYFFPNRDIGDLENIAGAGVLDSSHNKTDAEKFVAFLASAQAQQILADGNTYEYPTRPGIAPNPVLPPLSQIQPSVVNVASTRQRPRGGIVARRSRTNLVRVVRAFVSRTRLRAPSPLPLAARIAEHPHRRSAARAARLHRRGGARRRR